VVEEISRLKFENVYLADDTLFFTQRKIMDYARALLEALAPLNKKYFVSSTMRSTSTRLFLDSWRAPGKKFLLHAQRRPAIIRRYGRGA